MSDFSPYDAAGDLPRTVPLFPLGGALLLPRGRLPLNIFEPRYLTMIDDALARDRLVGMVQPRPDQSAAAKPDTYATGCVGRLTSFTETPDGRYLITLTGMCRFAVVEELETVTPYRQARVDFGSYAGDLRPAPDETAIPTDRLLGTLRGYLDKFGLEADWDSITQAPVETLVNSLSMICPFEQGEKQALLEAETLSARADALIALLEMASASHDEGDLPIQ